MAIRALDRDLLVGSELGHYHVVEKIGAGGMGDVYRARDQRLACDVAIKVLLPGALTDASACKHFRKEALILSQLNHPNVATIPTSTLSEVWTFWSWSTSLGSRSARR